jgi:uncharacterized protein
MTRVVAQSTSDGQLLWRLSVADVHGECPFSLFQGVDRVSVLVSGGPVELMGMNRNWSLDKIGSQASYAGDRPMRASTGKQLSRLWNVMTSRERMRAEVRVVNRSELWSASAQLTAVLVLRGRLRVRIAGGLEHELQAESGLVIRRRDPAVQLTQLTQGASWIRTTIDWA